MLHSPGILLYHIACCKQMTVLPIQKRLGMLNSYERPLALTRLVIVWTLQAATFVVML
jgi:hypothetical protein